MTCRRGATVVELMVSLLVGLLVLQLALGVLATARRAVAALEAGSEALAAVRIARHLLRAELRWGSRGLDWSAPAGDSLVLRAFRGTALACPERPSPGELRVTYSGVRAPDPEKDSLLLLTTDATWVAAGLASVRPTSEACAGESIPGALTLTLAEPVPPEVALARLFESGSYHLSGGALRYRRGGGGRQPLTPRALDTSAGGLRSAGDGVEVELVPTAALPAWRGRLR